MSIIAFVKSQPTYQQVPLDDDDKQMLMTIYDTRWRYALLSYTFMILLSALFSWGKLGNKRRLDLIHPAQNDWISGHADQQTMDAHDSYYRSTARRSSRWEDSEDAKYVSRNMVMFIAFSFLAIPICGAATYYFRKKVWTYKKDVKNGVKNKVPYVIMRKEYFEYTGQYYFGLDDPDYLHHEVDEAFFNRCNEGDTIYLYRAPLSGYTFEINGRFTL